ncbi:protein SMAX1-LIKE 4-like [Cucumis melo var. makuwa]|uniref:Protein SMAX1-LIKE 4-like n=2 Tax=Cucumis melo TaxID=3656 RepID=A0A1S3BXB2_CUCME|nr:protein SMAX1-LIKE 4-like [Cucumis melo]KAA0058207.1 protein SMAX1-LIKE 4-like [Cucumis melo var. makuwa]
MRSGGCAANQTFTPEAASVLKQSLSLARRRGHAQLTPLHVAVTLFSSRSSNLLRQACLKSQPHQTSHPLHCRALELCFNVALNRLPTTPGPLFHGQPSLSNALIAALKRAQANQRRGCLEQQQQQQQQQHQPVLAIKVELEQLIISILDDPSVSRVMREAGFSSTLVKSNLEDSSVSSVFHCYGSSGGIFSSPSSPSRTDHHSDQRDNLIFNPGDFWQTQFLTRSSEQNPLPFSPQKRVPNPNVIAESASSLKLDIKLVFEAMLGRKRKNTVIIGDSITMIEGLISELMGRVARGEVPNELKSTKFIEFVLSPDSLSSMKREDIEMKVAELRRNIDSITSRGWGAIIYTGDLKWMVETDVRVREETSFSSSKEASSYSQIDHMIEEISRLISFHSISCTKLWLVGTASYQTYMRCQMRHPTLETRWDLQAVPVPSDGSLGLSLHSFSLHGSRTTAFGHNPSQVWETKPFGIGREGQEKLSCCDCSSNHDKEVQPLKSSQQKELPSWLQPFSTQLSHLKSQEKSTMQSNESSSGSNFLNTWPNPFSTKNTMFQDSNTICFTEPSLKMSRSSNQMLKFRRQQSCITEFNFDKYQDATPSLDNLKNMEEDNKEVNISLSLGDSLFKDPKDLTKKSEATIQRDHLCKSLAEDVPWQSDTIPSIAEALMSFKSKNEELFWMVIEGDDKIGKRRLARAIAESIFGSVENLCKINARGNNEENPPSKIVENAMKTQEKLVVLVEDIDQGDPQFMKFLADGFQSGKFGGMDEKDRNTRQFIFILTSGGEGGDKETDSIIPMTMNIAINTGFGALSLDQKRRAEWESPINTKHQRTIKEEEEDANPNTNTIDAAKINGSGSLSRQSSFNKLDLNLKAEEDEEPQEKTEDDKIPPVTHPESPPKKLQFLQLIHNRFVFNETPLSKREQREWFKSKIVRSFEGVFGLKKQANFRVEERVLESISSRSDCFGNGVFNKWLTEIFETSLRGVGFGGQEGADVRLCLSGKEDGGIENGFKGTALPQIIKLSFMD